MGNRLDNLERVGGVPFELDFLRALGFEFGEDWDGEVLITAPASIDVHGMTELVGRFKKGIKRRLYFEGRNAMSVCVGGPCNGRRHNTSPGCCTPVLFHVGRAQWAVYGFKSYRDPRAWFLGTATNRQKARALWLSCQDVK